MILCYEYYGYILVINICSQQCLQFFIVALLIDEIVEHQKVRRLKKLVTLHDFVHTLEELDFGHTS